MGDKNLKLANLKVGLTVFIGLVIFFLFIFLVGTGGNYFASSYELKLFVQDVQGLAEGNLVSLGGIKIGTVKKLDFKTKNDVPGINIHLEILSKYKNQITKSSTAEIKTIGLLGDKFVDIKLGKPNETPLNEGDYIKFHKSLTINEISKELEPALNDFVVVMKNLRIISDSVSQGKGSLSQLLTDNTLSNDIKNVIHGLNSFIGSINSKKGTLGKLAYSDSIYNELASLTKNFNKISNSVSNGKGSLGKLISTDSLYHNLNALLTNLTGITDKLNADSSIAGSLVNNKKLYTTFKKLIMDLDSLSVDLKNNPDRYIQFSIF